MNKRTNKILLSLFLAASMFGTMGAPELVQAAEGTITMGTAANFAILSGETITNTGSTEITGDIGLYAGTDFPGITNVTHTGELHLNDDVALTAKNDLITAYNDAAGRSVTKEIPRELGGQKLTPGVYTSSEKDFLLNGILTLDAQGDPNAVFIFQTDSELITGSASSVVLTRNATACNVFWKVGSSATLGSNSIFAGSILAMTSISLKTGAQVRGQLLARDGSVTLDTNKVVSGPCTKTTTLNIIKVVVNENDDTAVAGDFIINIQKDGVNVDEKGSPGMDTPGRPYRLAPGTYTITEEAVEGYEASFSGDSEDGTITLVAGDEKTITITNTFVNGAIVSDARIEITKYDDNDNLLPGAEFTLYQNDVEVGEPLVTDENGMIVFTGLSKGDYAVQETRTPEGYVPSDLMEEIAIVEDDEVIKVSFINTKIMGTVNISKVDSKTDKALAGAGFVITDNAGAEVFKGMTDDKGMLLADLPYGKYVIEETTAPENYVKTDKKYSVDITENGQVFNLVVENTMTEEKGAVLPMAGDTTGTIFLFMGVLAVTGGILLMRKKQIA